MTPQEAARKFILDNFDRELFEFLDVVEWMDDGEVSVDTQDVYEDVYEAIGNELDVMIMRYADEEN